MAEVKWIKLNVGMFDGNSFKRIKKAKIGGESFRDKLTAVWFELMDFAGKCNAGGQLIESSEIPFSNIEDIAIIIDREPEELNLCMQYYITNRMVTVIDDVYMLTNWAKYQNEDGLEKIREQNRLRQAKYKNKKKLLLESNVTDNVTVTQGNATDKEEEKEKEEDKDKEHSLSESVAKRKRFTPPAPEKSCEDKKNYGTFENVMLSDDEYSKICEKYGKGTANELINSFSCKLKSKGYKSVNHCATIMQWAVEDGVKEKGSFDYDEFWELALARCYNESITPRAAIEREAIQRSEEKAKNPPKTAADDPDIRTQMEKLKERLNGA